MAYGFGPMFDLPNFAFSVPLAKFFVEGEVRTCTVLSFLHSA